MKPRLQDLRPLLRPDRAPLLVQHRADSGDERWIFRDLGRAAGDGADALNQLKSSAKRFPRFYTFMIRLVSPVYPCLWIITRFRGLAKGLVLYIGSGSDTLDADYVNVDYEDHRSVDIVADAHDIPFRDQTVGSVISIAMLEHVRDPNQVVREIARVLAPGGIVCSLIPFMQPFHASPWDFQRYTLPGIRALHSEFEEIEAGVASGPVSGFLWVLEEFLALLLSFGSKRLHAVWYIVFCLLLWPFKALDLIFSRFPNATILASSFYFIGRKRS